MVKRFHITIIILLTSFSVYAEMPTKGSFKAAYSWIALEETREKTDAYNGSLFEWTYDTASQNLHIQGDVPTIKLKGKTFIIPLSYIRNSGGVTTYQFKNNDGFGFIFYIDDTTNNVVYLSMGLGNDKALIMFVPDKKN